MLSILTAIQIGSVTDDWKFRKNSTIQAKSSIVIDLDMLQSRINSNKMQFFHPGSSMLLNRRTHRDAH